MHRSHFVAGRRKFLSGIAASAAALYAPGVFAEELIATPRLTEGPFYPDKLPLDTDNDLLVINDSITSAVGQITHLAGRILSPTGQAIRNAIIEIWQVDANGAYIHSADASSGRNDKNFQGYGRFMTDSKGQYYFRTIKPVPYTGRTPHIHVAVSRNGRRVLTTQILINGHPQNDGDMVARGIRDPLALETILVDFKPIPQSKLGELAANFDIVLGRTFDETGEASIRGGIGRSERNGGRGELQP
jgi:protocatechuate 3,4-dioxygenase beta subunit